VAATLLLLACARPVPPEALRAGLAAQVAPETETPTPPATATTTSTATRTRTPTRTATSPPTATPTSRWYGPSMAAAMRAVQTPCPSIPAGCFGQPPECLVDLCYCVRVCEPHGWRQAPGLSPDGVWAGRGVACSCRED
jgi:hypothetical protein